MEIKTKQLTAAVSVVIIAYCIPLLLAATISGILPTILVLLAIDYWRTRDPSFPHRTALKKYYKFRYGYFHGCYLTWKLKRAAANIKGYQDAVLSGILKLNGRTDYSRTWKLDQVQSREELRKVHRITKYQDISSYVERSAAGEKDVLVCDQPLYFCTTSGSTGVQNMIPFVSDSTMNFQRHGDFVNYSVGHIVPGARKLKRSMKLYYNPQRCLERTPGGILAGPATANAKISEFGECFTSPPAAFDIEDENLGRYIHLLFGLRYRDLTKIETVFVPIVYQAFEEMEKEWMNLVNDIRDGTLKADIKIDPETRRLIEDDLYPNPKRADELEREFKQGFINIAKRIWPKLALIECISGGPFLNYARLLREKYTDDILIYAAWYAASEGVLGVDIWPLNKACHYILYPWAHFYEFVKTENLADDQPETLFMDQVELNQEYEVIITNSCGLTRYRFGDVVKVVDFYGQIPVVEFQYRSGHMMNIRSEKMSELTFLECLRNLLPDIPQVQSIEDYAMCTSINLPEQAQKLGEEPHYVMFLELLTYDDFDVETFESSVPEQVDAKVVEVHYNYCFYRQKNSIGPLRIYLVKPGTFFGLRGYMLATSKASPNQLKIPRVITKPALAAYVYNERLNGK